MEVIAGTSGVARQLPLRGRKRSLRREVEGATWTWLVKYGIGMQ